jgi:hypothetical protein
LLLPASQAISKREAEEIRKFVAEGGTVVADFAVAQRDEHGAWQGGGLLADVFGFTVAKPESEFRLSRLKLPQPFGKTPAGEVGLFHACYGDGLAVQSAKPLAEVEALSLDEEKEFAKSVGQDKGRFPARHKSTRAPSIAPGARGPALLVNRFGKGNAVYLNFTLEAYVQAMRVPGFEEEFTEAQRVNLERGEKVRALFESILDLAGVPNPAAMTRVDGRKEFPPLYLHRNGEAWYLGFYPAEGQSDPMDWNLRDAYRLRMPAAGHLYDSREGKYVGQGQEADVKPVRGVAYVYACLPYKVEGIEAQAGPAQAGERLQGKARIVAADAKPCEHVLRLTVFDPSGAERSAYAANVVAKDGQVEFGFRLARDDPKGAWTLRLRDAATGVTGEGRFEVR